MSLLVRRPRAPGRLHPLGCREVCNPPGPADEPLPWARRLECGAAGFLTASALVQLHAWATGAPGVLELLGWVR